MEFLFFAAGGVLGLCGSGGAVWGFRKRCHASKEVTLLDEDKEGKSALHLKDFAKFGPRPFVYVRPVGRPEIMYVRPVGSLDNTSDIGENPNINNLT